jgi:hypothetical protein
MHLALSDMSNAEFNLYVVALAVSGVLMLILAGIGFGAQVSARVLSAVFGFLFLGYAFYLYFIFTTGTVWESYYVFIVPILFIVQVVQVWKAKRAKAPKPPSGGAA